LHFRDSLGLVTYDAGNAPLEHAPFMVALGAPRGATQYPGFSNDPHDGCRHLALDLWAFAAEFVMGDAAMLQAEARQAG
jgi:hypothetical protein